MPTIYLYTLASVLVVSVLSFCGALTLALRPEKLKKITIFLVSLSAGTLLGGAFLHIIPEMVEEKGDEAFIWIYLLGGIVIFFILEKIICWRHCHIPTSEEHPHHLGIMNMVGDGFHNFLDGIIIAGSYLISVEVGLATTVAVIFHELPQELGDFGVMIHAGFKYTKALFLNFLTALTAVLGAVLTLIIGPQIENLASYILPLAAGGFIYIATADLIPELKKDSKPLKSIIQLITILIGIALMYALKFIE